MSEVSSEKAQTWVERTRARLNSTPEGRAALAEAKEQSKFTIQRPCSEGNCVDLIDSRTGENTGGWGPVGCPCQDADLTAPPSQPAPPTAEADTSAGGL